MDKSKSPLKVALHGMEDRTAKTMVMYLQGPCRGDAVVVSDSEADVDVFDADVAGVGALMDAHRAKKPHRPVIALSLRDGELAHVFYVKKPVKTHDMLGALNKAVAFLGKIKRSRVPRPASLFSVTLPPSTSVTRLYTICKPNPEPPCPSLVVKKGSNT